MTVRLMRRAYLPAGNLRQARLVDSTRMTGIHADTHTTAGRWRPAGGVVPLFVLAVVVLVPWIVFLVRSLPSTEAAAHWDIAWAGFDVVELHGLDGRVHVAQRHGDDAGRDADAA